MHPSFLSVDAPGSIAATSQQKTSPKLARRAAGECIEVLGQQARVRIGSRDTGGVLALLELEIRPHEGAPYHVHRNEDEVFFVRQGCFEFILDGAKHQVETGDMIYGPRDVPHTFRNLDSQTSILQVVALGNGVEQFLRCCAEALAVGSGKQAPAGIAAAHNIEFVAPDTPFVRQSKGGARPKIIRVTEQKSGAGLLQAFGACRFQLESGDTAGTLCSSLHETPSCSGPPLHMHEREDELFLIESGCYEFQLGTARIHANAGDAVWAPRCVPHTFRVISDTPGLMLTLNTPGGFDQFFRATAEVFANEQASPERLAQIGTDYGIHFLPVEL
ncbi:MAG TPA: cupin domain-containing protein [Abditibacteriaceae bacterium]